VGFASLQQYEGTKPISSLNWQAKAPALPETLVPENEGEKGVAAAGASRTYRRADPAASDLERNFGGLDGWMAGGLARFVPAPLYPMETAISAIRTPSGVNGFEPICLPVDLLHEGEPPFSR